MSDGNFNRSLLPHTPYQSGMRMGKSMARKYALLSFADYLSRRYPDISDETIKQETERFSSILSEYPF